MKKYVFTVKDDVCAKNNKDVNATALLEKMRLYGTVESYDSNMVAVKAEYQSVIDELTARYDAIKSLNLSADEISLVNLYRSLKAETAAAYVAEVNTVKAELGAENEALKKQLEDIKVENEGRIAKIAAILASASDEVSK